MRRAFLLVCLLPGCSFPDPLISDEPPADTSIADSSGDTTTEETSVEDAATDGGDVSTDGATDARADAADTYECASPDPCDCDGDMDRAKRTGCPGGNDCDDGDSRRNSKVNSFQSYSLAGVTGHAGDWNCNNTVEREFGDGSFSCGGITLGGTACTGAVGYKESMPVCGAMATKVTCKLSTGVLCVMASETMVTVLCK